MQLGSPQGVWNWEKSGEFAGDFFALPCCFWSSLKKAQLEGIPIVTACSHSLGPKAAVWECSPSATIQAVASFSGTGSNPGFSVTSAALG